MTFTIELLLLSTTLVILFSSGSRLDVFQMPPHRQAVPVTRSLPKDALFFKIKIIAKQKTPEHLKRIELSRKLTKLRLERNVNPEDIECNNLALE